MEASATSKMEVDQTAATTPSTFEGPSKTSPIVLIVMGMAGSGKTTFTHVSTSL